MRNEDCRLTPFTADEPRQQRRIRYETEAFRAWTRKKQRFQSRSGSMLAKIGICMAILASVMLVEMLLLRENEEAAVATGTDTAAGETENDDVLGRLKFVSVGGVKSVFQISQRWNLPVEKLHDAKLAEDDTLLCISADAGKTVSLPAAGEVRTVAFDSVYGNYVRMNHGSDLESVYYHLADVCVEEGQPLAAFDTLGKVSEDGKLYVAVLRGGVKQNPAAYLDTELLP